MASFPTILCKHKNTLTLDARSLYMFVICHAFLSSEHFQFELKCTVTSLNIYELGL